MAGDALQFGEVLQRSLAVEVEQLPLTQGVTDHHWCAVRQKVALETLGIQLRGRDSFYLGQLWQAGRYTFAVTRWCDMALVHVGLLRRHPLARQVDDLRQQSGQAQVAADFQPAASKQLFDVGAAGHDAQQVLLGDLDGDIRRGMPTGLGARLGTSFAPVGLLRAEDELEGAFDADGTGIGKQLAQQRLQFHGAASSWGGM
ncbi:hypothetical protein D3C81_1533640 [compost metagenome]